MKLSVIVPVFNEKRTIEEVLRRIKNVEIKKVRKPKKFNFLVKGHVELGEKLGMLDFDSSAKVAGKGFYYLR